MKNTPMDHLRTRRQKLKFQAAITDKAVDQQRASKRHNYTRRGVLVALMLLTLLMSGTLITALTLNSVTPSWGGAVGSSGAPTCLTTTTVGAEAQLRFGDDDFVAGCPADPNAQSGLGFEGSAGVTFADGTPFVLGELTHYNNPIFADSLLTSAQLSLTVDLGDPLHTASLTTTVMLDETANNLTTCPYGDTQPCADRIRITRQSQLFTVAGQNYQLEILGVIPGQMGSCAYNEALLDQSFISDENAANSACLFGRLTPVQDAELVIEKQSSLAQASPGDIVDYQIDYNCFSTTTFCAGVVLTDYLPDEVIYLGSTGSTHTVSATGTYTDNNHSVRFVFIDPLPAGSTGFVRVRVRVRDDGTLADGQTISNLATSALTNGPTSEATHSMPTVVTSNWQVVKTSPSPVYLDTESPYTDNTYQVGICSSGSDVNLLGATMVDTLPTDAVFVSATGSPQYDAGPPQTLTWNLGDLNAADGCHYETVTLRYPSPPFVEGQMVTNTVDAAGTIVGGVPWTDTASVTDPLDNFLPLPQVAMSKSPARSGYIVGARADFLLAPRNTGNVPLQQFTVTDTLPDQIDLTSVTVGNFTGYSGFVTLRYERSDNPGIWVTWPGSPFANNSGAQNVSALGLPSGVWVTRVQWDFGTVLPGFAAVDAGGRIRLSGTVLPTDRNGTPVTEGDTITNTAVLDWGYTPSSGDPGVSGSEVGSANIDVEAFPIPDFDKTSAGGVSAAWRFLIGQQVGYYNLTFNNNTGIAVDDFTLTDTIPPQFNVSSVTVGSYHNFSGTVNVLYQATNNPGVWQTWGSGLTPANQTLDVSSLGLPAGVYITHVRWQYGTVGADFRTNTAPRINGSVINPDRNGNPVNDGDSMNNSAEMTWTFEGTPNTDTDVQNDTVRIPVANPLMQKTTTTSGPYIPTSRVTYALRVGAAGSSPSVLINPIVIELLPPNLQYVAGSWAYDAGSTGVPAPTFEQIDDYNGTGRTLLRWRFTGSFTQGQFATITLDTNILAGAAEGTLTNEYYITSNDVVIDGTIIDVNDLDGDTVITDVLVGANTSIPVDELVGLDSYKGVRGELDTAYSVYPDSGYTIPNGSVDYRLTIINRGNIPINNVKVIDILPFVGDTGVQDTRPRDSAWRPFLTAPVVAPAGVTVYYSTSSNPCRPQIIPSGPAGCTAPNWSTLPPADISTVQSLRFDFAETLQPGQSFNFSWTMQAPDDAPTGSIAWNSFAYTSTNANTGVPLRPAEPNKVGIEMTRPAVAPLIDLEKFINGVDADLPTGPYIAIGDPAVWTYVITNTGNTRLANITLTDDQIDPLVCDGGVTIPNLDPGESFTCTVTGVAVIDQYANLGTVTGDPVDAGDLPLTDDDGNPLPPVTDQDPAHYFGYDPLLARLGNYVWIDSNGDGAQDAGEPGLPGVTVNLYQASSPTPIATTQTDGNGFYLFPNLAPDDYFVEFIIPPTYSFTTQDAATATEATDSDANITTGRTAVTTLDPGEEDLTWDAGVIAAASIGDRVWRDGNGNNVQDPGEVGFAGVQVDLLNSAGVVIATTFTDAEGYYSFTDLAPGDYAVQFTPPPGYLLSLPDVGGDDTVDSDADPLTFRTATTTLSPGENDPTWDAGLVQVASIGNFVWRDNDYDGQQDAGEPGIAGITVNLLDSSGNVISTTVTDSSGFYSFTGLRPGDYAIEVIRPATGFIFTTRDAGSDITDSDADTTTGRTVTTTLSPGENDLTWDVGLVPLASIGDRVWIDSNNNGQQDTGELGIAGIRVNLLDGAGNVIASTTTGANGNYLFDELIPGVYAIEVIRPVGYVFSPRDVGNNNSDSDVNRTTGRSSNTTLSPGENDLSWDAGLVQDASIGNYVWYDTDDDGVQDIDEPGAPGVTVRLIDGSGSVIATTVTNANGFYLFDFLTPGDYAVEFVPPAGYALARRDQGGDDAADSDPHRFTGRTTTTTLSPGEDDLTWDAGLVEVASIGDRVWIDLNDNGIQDNDEVGLSGVTVRLLDASGTVIMTDTTNANGFYLFDNLPPDIYSIEVVPPANYVFSTQDAGTDDAADSDVNITTGRTIQTALTPGENDLTWDAGLVPAASIGDRVWIDLNNNGVQDSGETGIGGVTVRLLDSSNTVIATTVTNPSGSYSFTNLRPGTYSVEFVLPAGYQFSPQDAAAATDATDSDADPTTGRTIQTVLSPGENDLTWDAGIVPLASIGNRVWIDLNNNGVQDSGESGLFGVTVNLLDSAGTVIDTTTTDTDGIYGFANLPPDVEYAIEVVLPTGYQFSPRDAAAATDATDSDVDPATGRTINTLLSPNESDLTWDAGVVPLASIGDRVWIDINNNGVQDSGESGLFGVTVNLLNSSGTVIDTTTTDTDGIYGFTNLPPDVEYAIEVVLPAGYQFSPRDAAAATDATDSDVDPTTGRTINTLLSPNEFDLTWDAGVVPLASIGDTVWRDLNGNGAQDAGETGLFGVTVNLLDSAGTVIDTTTTDADGNYLFDLLPPGNYAIEVVLPVGYIFSPQDAAADTADSDVDTTTGRSILTTLDPDEDDMTWDAGLVPLASIGDTVWSDNNANGIQDAGEPGVSGVIVNLLDSTGTVIDTTITDANGQYLFENLLPGDYAIEFILPAGYIFTGQDQGGDDALDSDADPTTGRTPTTTLIYGENDMTWDAGLIPLGSIGDTIWLDSNGNGVQDGSEPGIPNVRVTLIYPDGTQATTITDNNGRYLFEDLPPGVYVVIVDINTLPPGLIQTGDPDSIFDSRSVVNLAPGQHNLLQDFGYQPQRSGGLTPTPTPLAPEEAPTEEAQTFAPVAACQRACVNWQLYHTNQTGDWEIFRLGNLSDRPAVSPNLSQGEGYDDVAPTRSPNAEWIVFSSNRDGNWELYVAPTDGDSSKTRRLTYNTVAIDTDPVWGPNSFVVYESTRDGNWELYLLDMTTGVETRLTDNPANDINAYWSPDGTKLLFQSDRSGRWQIYELNLRTGTITRLSDGTSDDVDPQYNNAGDAIAFRSYRDNAPNTPQDERHSAIYTMNADGTNPTRISDPAGDATSHSWSPDDALIAYQSDLDGDLDIYVYQVGTGQTRQLTNNDIPDYAPVWQCGTTQVIFTSEVNGNPDIYDAEALPIAAPPVQVEKDAQQLTFDPADDIYPLNDPTEENASREGRLPGAAPVLGEQTSFIHPEFPLTEVDPSLDTGQEWESINSCEMICPAWSLYHSDRTGDWEIFRLGDQAAGDTGEFNISSGVGANDFGPTRAPNGQFVAFTSNRDGNNELYIAASNGSSLQRATFNPANDTDPAWSLDSQRIVFESDRSGNWNLYILDVQTGVETQITDHPADDMNASWSAAGGKIAFQSNRDGVWAIYVYDLATREITRLTDTAANATDPVYGNTGSYIAYRAEQPDGKTALFIMQEDGSSPLMISDPAGSARNAAWYFDDTLLAYQSDLDGDDDIYVYDFASGTTRKLTENTVPDYAPTWQCGSKDVIFTSDAPGSADIFRAPALPIDAAPIHVESDAQQLTDSTATDRYPMGAPTDENASRDLGADE